MQSIHSEADIKLAIIHLEKKQLNEEALLKQQVIMIGESLLPINIIKSTLGEATATPEIKNEFFEKIIGITAGYLTKVVLESTTDNPAKKVVGTAVIYGVAQIAINNPEAVKSAGRVVFNALRTKPSS
jgi:hypothetical protein